MHRLLFVIFSLSLIACDELPSPPPSPAWSNEAQCSGPPLIEVGVGDRDWSPLQNGDAVQLINGPQGGWHVVGAVKAHNLGEIVNITFSIVEVDAWRELAYSSYTVQLIADQPCSGFFPGMLAIIDPTVYDNSADQTIYDQLEGRNLLLKMTVQSELGESSAEVVVEATF